MGGGAKKDLTARQGVEDVRSLFLKELGWYPREPSDPDYGIDIYIECADDGVPNGRMFGVQVKSGESFFSEETYDGMVFRADARHLDYWLNHSLPVLVVLYDPATETAFWQVITESTAVSSRQGYKVAVPRTQVLDASSSEALAEIAQGDPYELRLNQLRSDRTWMVTLRDGGEVFVEVEEWVNKTSGRGEIRLVRARPEGGDPVVRSRWFFLGFAPYEDVLPSLFPWGSLSVDEEVYDQHDEEQWEREEGHYDSEERRVIAYGQSFHDWRASRGLSGLRPYTVEADEVAHWRLRLELNDLGTSFLAVDSYLNEGLG